MSIASAITAAQGRVADAYTAISNKGGTLPATQNLSNMPTAIASIPSGGEPYKYNFETIGTPIVTGCVANNFSQSNYLLSPELLATRTPQKIHFYTRAYMSDNNSSFLFVLFNNNYRCGIATWGASWKLCTTLGNYNGGSYTPGNWYDLHVIQENDRCDLYANNQLYASGSGVIWDISETVNAVVGTSVVWESFSGFIDLSQTYIAFDDNIVWKAVE